MKIEELKSRIEALQLKMKKKGKTIQKKEATMQKKVEAFKKNYGITFDGYSYSIPELQDMGLSKYDAEEAYWKACEITDLQEDLKRLPKDLAEMQKRMKKYNEQLAEEVGKASVGTPDVLKTLLKELVLKWDTWDKEKQEELQKEYKEVGYDRFFHELKHSLAEFEFMSKDTEKIHELNTILAEKEIMDLQNRVKDITGEITDWSGIQMERGNSFPVLTGTVVGKNGIAFVQTIVAGGYNIQRLHIRTLVHRI